MQVATGEFAAALREQDPDGSMPEYGQTDSLTTVRCRSYRLPDCSQEILSGKEATAAMKTARPGRYRKFMLAAGIASLLASAGAILQTSTAVATDFRGSVPRPDHLVVVVMENKDFGDVIGRPDLAPYTNKILAAQGAVITDSHGITHPSQPNYIGLFSGATQGVTNDDCPKNFFGVPNLGSDLISHGYSFAGYSESLPGEGSTTCGSGDYARKHNPWVDFDNVPASSNKTFSEFPSDYSQLPTVSFVVPNLCNDTHNCPVNTGDAWLLHNIDSYYQWAKTHNSSLVLTYDEDDGSDSNRIPTIFAGAHVKAGTYGDFMDHYSLLRAIENMYSLPIRGNAANRNTPVDFWDVNRIEGAGSGRCVDVNSGFNANGTPIQLWDCNSTAAQAWTATGEGTLEALGKCMDVNGGGTANGTRVQLWDCNGTGAQKWARGSGGTLVNPQSGRCLDATGFGTANGTPLQIWDCFGTTNQVWSITSPRPS